LAAHSNTSILDSISAIKHQHRQHSAITFSAAMALPVSKLTGSKRAAEIEEQRSKERDQRAAAAKAEMAELQKKWVGKFEAWALADQAEHDRLQRLELQTKRDLLQEESQLRYLAMQTTSEDCCMQNPKCFSKAFQLSCSHEQMLTRRRPC
jgi:hypothetical protein